MPQVRAGRKNLADMIAVMMWGPQTIQMVLAKTNIKDYATVHRFLRDLHEVGVVRKAGKYQPYDMANAGHSATVWAWQTTPFALEDTPNVLWCGDSPKSGNEVTLHRVVTP